ncbi:MAG TPA: hypothetical protein VN698_03445 [Bacteroidia bacterium]|nr:hypothetical protein [Bacteroidia bacterium]
MRKKSNYKPKSKQELLYKLNSLFDKNKHQPLETQTIEKIKFKFNTFHQNMLNNVCTFQDILFLNGIIIMLKVISENSRRLSLNEQLHLYITAEPVRKDIAERHMQDKIAGYKDDKEIQILQKTYTTVINALNNMTNIVYDEFINLIRKAQAKAGAVVAEDYY